MKKLAILLIVLGSLLSGCVVHDGPAYRDRDGDGVPNRVDRDRDGDGVPNRYDGRPANPNRY
jgi:hypothetical protein